MNNSFFKVIAFVKTKTKRKVSIPNIGDAKINIGVKKRESDYLNGYLKVIKSLGFQKIRILNRKIGLLFLYKSKSTFSLEQSLFYVI